MPAPNILVPLNQNVERHALRNSEAAVFPPNRGPRCMGTSLMRRQACLCQALGHPLRIEFGVPDGDEYGEHQHDEFKSRTVSSEKIGKSKNDKGERLIKGRLLSDGVEIGLYLVAPGTEGAWRRGRLP